jgi:hypothetical protein
MFDPLIPPALALLVSLPFFGSPKSAAPQDTIPPVWKTPSLLAVESAFVRAKLADLTPGPPSLVFTFDPRRLRVELNAESSAVVTHAEVGEVPVGDRVRLDLTEYGRQLTWTHFREGWEQKSRTSVNMLGAATPRGPSGQGISFNLPSPLPPRIQSLLGPGGPALNVSGSETIRLSGQSNWTNLETGLLGQKKSLFPSLNMQQDLDINLEGQLSDRIKVNLLQQSANPIPLSNRIAINYKGDEDDLVQSLDLGNTSLTLPGTQFVSYSGRNEGLFGAKLGTRVGPLDFTVLASKQEGRSERGSYAGGASKQMQTLADLDYVPGVYFMLYDPNETGTLEIDEASIKIYLDDYNSSNDQNVFRGRAFPDPIAANAAFPDSADTVSVGGTYAELQPGDDLDYEVFNNIYGPYYKVIRLRRPVSGEQRLAAAFLARPVDPLTGQGTGEFVRYGSDSLRIGLDGEPVRYLKLLRPPVGVLRQSGPDFDPNDVFTRVRDLELKNFYQLAGQNIDPATFKLSIRRGVEQPYQTVVERDDATVPYIEILGLDSVDESSGTPVFGRPDNEVDGVRAAETAAQFGGSVRALIDFANGTLFFPDLRPFAPRLLDSDGSPFERVISHTVSRRDSLVGVGTEDNAANPKVYDKYNIQRQLDAVYYIDVDFTAAKASGTLTLGRGNILEGSDVVTINGQVLQRGQDYDIDYDLGRVTLKRQLGAADNLNVDYSYAPLFQSAGRTLLGSAFSWQGIDRAIGGAFMYESKGAQDLRPRIGEEPSRSMIGDLNTAFTLRPDWMTRFVDRLPGVRTTASSEIAVQAEVGASFPNPNTRNEVFVDDMEGVRDAISMLLTPERWAYAAVPLRKQSGINTPYTALPRWALGELHWYTPLNAVKEGELKPNLTDAQGRQNPRQALAFSVPRRPTTAVNTPGLEDSLWAGLTYLLDPVGFDLSRSQYIDLWVNDFRDYHSGALRPRIRGRNVQLHIDLGRVPEDQMRAPNRPPNGRIDSEDRNRDNQLTVTSSYDEDTGYDGLLNIKKGDDVASEPDSTLARPDLPDLSTVDPSRGDHEGDDFRTVDENFREIDPRRYLYTNGTEGNRTVRPFPDTEDLNLNTNLDTYDDYNEYTIDLGDENHPWLLTDVYRDFPGVAVDNGWRRYRIPISDSLATQFGQPNLALTQHVRVWFSGLIDPDPDPDSLMVEEQRPLVMIGGLEVVGSRWQLADLDSAQIANAAGATLNSVNNVDNAEIYVAPFDPGNTRSGNQEINRREQSIALEFVRLSPGDTLEAFKNFSVDEDYTRYGQLTWFAAGFRIPGYDPASDSLQYFIRFSSDDIGSSYYEYRAPMPPSSEAMSIFWQRVDLALTALSNLKLNADFPKQNPILYQVTGSAPGETYTVRGRPSLTRLRRVSFGVMNQHSAGGRTYDTGQLWFNELRATDVDKTAGRAQRVNVNGRLANLINYNASWNGRDANFITVGQSIGAGSSTDQLSFGTSLDLHRFFETTGIILPVRYQYSRNSLKPRFTAGDDVVRTGAAAEASETLGETRTWSANYSRNWSDRSNPFLRYTIGGITASATRTESDGSNPSSVDRGTTFAGAVSYSVSLRRLLTFRVPGTRINLFPLPEQAFWNYSVNTRQNVTFDRLQDSTGTLRERSRIDGRTAFIAFGLTSRPVDLLTHQISGTRNLTLRDDLLEKVGFLNLGRVVNWRQTFNSRYQFRGNTWLQPSLGWNSNYSQNNGPELSQDLSVRGIGNNQSYTMTWSLPFDQLGAAPRRAAGDTTVATVPVWRRLLGRLGPIATDASYSQQSAYSRVTGTPDFLYLTGLHSDPGLEPDSTGRVQAQLGNQAVTASDWRTAARSSLRLPRTAVISSRIEFSQRNSDANGVTRRTDSSRYPDLDLQYGDLPKLIGLDRFLSNPRLRTAYNRSQSTEFVNASSPTSIATSSQWQPLLGVNGELRNGTRAELKIERRVTQRENLQNGRSITTDRNTDVNLNLNRTYSKGQKVSVLGRETTVRQTVTLGLTAVFSRRSGETVQQGLLLPQLPIEEDRLSVNANGSYGFSQNVNGGVTLGFGQTRDLQRDIIRRNVRVEMRASLTF